MARYGTRSFWWGRRLCLRRMFLLQKLVIVRRRRYAGWDIGGIGVLAYGDGHVEERTGRGIFGVRLWAMRISIGRPAKLPCQWNNEKRRVIRNYGVKEWC